MIITKSNQSQLHSGEKLDIILVSGDYWADHPQSGIGVIARVLDSQNYNIGIIEKPDWTKVDDFLSFGIPKLFLGVTSGAIDSMLQNYTPLKKPRSKDPYNPFDSKIPDRAVIVYSQMIQRAQNLFNKKKNLKKIKKVPIILGGVEASLRRFTHYDYWDNKLRKSILFDSKADLLVYGPGEYQIVEIAKRLSNNENLSNIEGTCEILKEIPKNFNGIQLPSYESVLKDKKKFCEMQLKFSNQECLIQKVGNRYLVQYQMYNYKTSDLDNLYSLPFSYEIPTKFQEFQMAQFSIITHRGCFGNCNFCSIALHQGTKIISRSKENIIKEINKLKKHPEFKGFISDLGGPSANMYGMDCKYRLNCKKNCLNCSLLNLSHKNITELLIKTRKISGIKKIFVRSGIRYDLTLDLESDEYIEELSKHHISGFLKIAPEHFSQRILKLMNKDNSRFDEFKEKFDKINQKYKQTLKYYFITAHPGSKMEDVKILKKKIEELGFKSCESIQIFTPTPMSMSSCIYWTGLNPDTLKKVFVPYSYNSKKKQKNYLYPTNQKTGSRYRRIKNRSRSRNRI